MSFIFLFRKHKPFKIVSTGDFPPVASVRRILARREHLVFPKYVFSQNKRYTINGFVPGSFRKSNTRSIAFSRDSEVKELINNPFRGSKLTCIELPAGIERLNYTTFYELKELEEIYLSEKNKNYKVFDGKIVYQKNPNALIYTVKDVKQINLPDDLELIDDFSAANTCIESIEIPKNVESINRFAFSSCKDLKSVVFQMNTKLINIGESAFEKCINLEQCTITASVERIEPKAFKGCSKLVDVNIPETSALMEMNGFSYSGIKSIHIPSSCRKIAPQAFELTQNLQEVIFSEDSSCKVIGEEAFKGSHLKHILIPKSITKIEKSAFEGSLIEEVKFEEGSKLKIIGARAFYGCIRLKNIELPESVEEIGDQCFKDFECLKVGIPENSKLKLIGKEAFKNTGIKRIQLPVSIEEINEAAFQDSGLEQLIFHPDSKICFLNTLSFSGCKKLCFVEFSDNIQIIGEGVFFGCSKLNRILFRTSSKLKRIEKMAFSHTSLYNFICPQHVEFIGTAAFGCIRSLKIVDFSNAQCLEEIGIKSFGNCSLEKVEFPEALKIINLGAFENNNFLREVSFEICNNLELIGAEAFNDCQLSCVTFPVSLKVIQDRAFIDNNLLRKIILPTNSMLSMVGIWVFPESLETVDTDNEELRTLLIYS